MRVARPIALNPDEKRSLEQCARARSLPLRLVERARIVLLAASGQQDKQIAAQLQITAHKVARWRKRYLDAGWTGMQKDAPRPGRTPKVSAAQVQNIIRKTTQQKPANATHWSTRSMAAAVGLSETTVRRIWRKHGLKPHLAETFKVSSDPQFAEKLEAIAGLYLNPPEHALALSCDEKSQIQALDRTQPSLPLKPGRAGTLTHDYKRNGTATLFAALNTADGKIISLCQQRHRHQEWLRFLRLLNDSTDEHQQLHLILDNYATHKHPKVQRWLKRHPRFHFHFTPTSASWLNMVERFFRDLSARRLRRGVFGDVPELVHAINDSVDQHNDKPKPFIWTASANDILEKLNRARATLVKVQSV